MSKTKTRMGLLQGELLELNAQLIDSPVASGRVVPKKRSEKQEEVLKTFPGGGHLGSVIR